MIELRKDKFDREQDERVYNLSVLKVTRKEIELLEGLNYKQVRNSLDRHNIVIKERKKIARKVELSKVVKDPVQHMKQIAYRTGVWADVTCRPFTYRTFTCNK